jgi:eukaryotic-like serine/threonine-protein kinase
MNLPPNLAPSPAADRPALLRALAKRPDDRWPTVSAFVRALVGGSGGSKLHTRVVVSAPEVETPRTSGVDPGAVYVPPSPPPVFEGPRSGEAAGPIFTPAPPELTGPGPLRPALVIGLGQTGLRVIQRLRFDLSERYGQAGLTPALRTFYIDTDPETLEESARERPDDRLAALTPDQVFPAKLNRPTHYQKPRLNGRTLTEGWFDPQLIYKLPRVPQTLGMRLFGRLAFLDHYRFIMGKVQAEIEAAVAPDALLLTEARTGMQRRTNRPRVYIVGGLAGGTGGGMFLDLAYATRSRLKRMGYDAPEIIGLFVLPSADATLTPPQSLANTYAALVELNHFSRPDTVFSAHFDERQGAVSEKDAPFTQCYLLPGSGTSLPAVSGSSRRTPPPIPAPRPRGSGGVAKPGSRVVPMGAQRTPDPAARAAALKPYSDAAERIRLDLFASIGRTADNVREARAAEREVAANAPVTVSAFGLATFDWPRAEVVGRTALVVGRKVLDRWAAPDAKRFHEIMPGLAATRWAQLGFDPDKLIGHLQRAADLAAGGKVEELIGLVTEPLVPRGWLARAPEPMQVTLALDTLNKLLGPPVAPAKRQPNAVEEALAKAAAAAGATFVSDLGNALPLLVDDPQFRLAGTEEMYRQFLANTDRLIDRYLQSIAELEAKAVAGFECLTHHAHFQKGMRKATAAELTEALRQYPRARFQALTFRQLVAVYQTVREALGGQLAEVSLARQRLATIAATIRPDDAVDPPVSLRKLMPPGCSTVGAAVQRVLRVLTDTDLAEIDRRVQAVLEPEGGGLLNVCLNSSSGAAGVAAVVFEEARAHLDVLLGEVGLAAMFAERFRTPQQAERAIEQAYQEAEPAWVGNGPWLASELAVLACPAGASGEALRELARRAIPVAGLPVTDSRDDLTVYREWSDIPLAALPHLGPAAAAAYEGLPETHQCTPHARLDVTRWLNVDAD